MHVSELNEEKTSLLEIKEVFESATQNLKVNFYSKQDRDQHLKHLEVI